MKYDGNWMRELVTKPIVSEHSSKYTIESRLTKSEFDDYFDYILKTGHVSEVSHCADMDIIFELFCKDYEDEISKK